MKTWIEHDEENESYNLYYGNQKSAINIKAQVYYTYDDKFCGYEIETDGEYQDFKSIELNAQVNLWIWGRR